MPPKGPAVVVGDHSSTYGESRSTVVSPRSVSLWVKLIGEVPVIPPGDWHFLMIFNGLVLLEGKWKNELILELEEMPYDLKDPVCQGLVADKPLIFLLRSPAGKGSKEPDPLMNVDNRAGGTVDLLPLVLGEDDVITKVSLVLLATGEQSGCRVEVRARAKGTLSNSLVPLLLTMISAHCLPISIKDNTVYLAALGLDGLGQERPAVNFGLSLSSSTANKLVWATASTAQRAADTAYFLSEEDKFIPRDFEAHNTSTCLSVYWNAVKRVLVDPTLLRERLSSQFFIEVAGVPMTGKQDVRGRYTGFIDAAALLEPGQFSLTTCAKLKYFSETDFLGNVGPLLDLAPTSAKASARKGPVTDIVMDEHGHTAYIELRFDLMDKLVPKAKIVSLFETIGFSLPEGPITPQDELHMDLPPEDHLIDVRRIREEGGALAVHKELSGLACRGVVPMNQSIKRTAANRLLMRVRAMLKQFVPGECSYIDWQDLVSSQHAASRRAVTASFAPQPPPMRASGRFAAARCRMAGDTRIADKHISNNLKVAGNHPRVLLSKILRCLEVRSDWEARNILFKALSSQTRNRYLLWIYGAQEFDKGEEAMDAAKAAFLITTKGDYSDGTSLAIGWASLHAVHHYDESPYAAFVAAKKMRKSYELPKEWKTFLKRWEDTSGEEERFWRPSAVSSNNPLLIAAAFFLCLRCYKFSERLLQCLEEGCGTRGSYRCLVTKISPDVFYLRAASLIMRSQIDRALEITDAGLKWFGPSPLISQMRTTCLFSKSGWIDTCEDALQESERAGSESCPGLLLQAALAGIKTGPEAALQRAARAHKITPCAHSALIIGRVYARMGKDDLAVRWAAAAVNAEPYLADGWAVLALLAMRERDVDKARTMLRTAKQVGPISEDIEKELKKKIDAIKVEMLPDAMVKNLCFCDYLSEK